MKKISLLGEYSSMGKLVSDIGANTREFNVSLNSDLFGNKYVMIP